MHVMTTYKRMFVHEKYEEKLDEKSSHTKIGPQTKKYDENYDNKGATPMKIPMSRDMLSKTE